MTNQACTTLHSHNAGWARSEDLDPRGDRWDDYAGNGGVRGALPATAAVAAAAVGAPVRACAGLTRRRVTAESTG